MRNQHKSNVMFAGKAKKNLNSPKYIFFSVWEVLRKCKAVLAHAFNPSTQEAEIGRSLSLRPAWSTQGVPGQPGLHKESLFQQTSQKT